MKRGFTLIELLAVLIVLAIIAVIAVPIVLNVIKETKEKSYDISVENVMRAAKIYDLESELTDTAILMDQNIYSDLKNRLNGTKPDNGVVYIKASSVSTSKEIAFALKYGEWCYTKAYGEKTYSKEKSETCEVPFDYLMEEVHPVGLNTTVWITDLYLDNNFGITRDKVGTVTIKPNIDIPSEYDDQKWIVSESGNSKIMAWYDYNSQTNLYDIYIGQEGGVKANSDSGYLFAFLTNATEIDLTYFDTTNVTDMQGMFAGNKKMEKIIYNNFDTSQVESMYYMFAWCFKLSNLDVSNFNTSKVTSMASMFNGCSSLTTLDVSNFNTSKVGTDKAKIGSMYAMFDGCKKLKYLDVSKWDTSNVTSMRGMFGACNELEDLDVSNFDTSKVTSMASMFSGCMKLEKIDVSNFNTTEVTNMDSMFLNCKLIKNLDLSNWNTKSVTSMAGMFAGCYNLKPIYVGENWIIASTATDMFNNCATQNEEQLCKPDSTHEWCVIN